MADLPLVDWKRKESRPHKRQVFCVGWNAEGRRLGSGSVDSTIKVTKVDDYQFSTECELRGPSDTVMSLLWHPTHADKLASVGSQDKNVRFWDVREREGRRNTATVPTAAPIFNMVWSSDGHYIAIGDKQETVSILDVRRMKILHKYPNSVQVNGLAWSKDMSLFFQGTGRGELEVFAYPEMKKLRALHGHTSTLHAVALDRQNKYLATGGADAVVSLWDMDDFICVRTYSKMDHAVRALSFSHDSRYLAIGVDEQNLLEVENVETGHSLGRVQLKGRVDDLAFNPKLHMLAFPGEYGRDHIGDFGSVEFRWLPPK